MKRERMDQAALAQIDRLTYLLRDVERNGGEDHWRHLWSRGHRYPTILSAIRQMYLSKCGVCSYKITVSGKRYLTTLDEAQLRSA